jgi:hypothetical protein
MKLLSVSTLQAAVRVAGDLAKTNAACSAALDNATARVAAEMRESFDLKTSVSETFHVNPRDGLNMGSQSVPVWRGRFALKNGFLTTTPVVTYAGSLPTLSSSPETVSADYLSVNLLKGDVHVMGLDLRAKFVRITYSSGFTVDADDAQLYAVPAAYTWLVEAAKSFAVAELIRVAPDIMSPDSADGEGAARPTPNAAERNARALLAPYIRYFPDAIRAVA